MGMTIKDYAAARGKTVQAVYKQIHAKENAEVKNHICKEKRGNKSIQVLDNEAIKILDSASRQAPVIINQTAKDTELENFRLENENLKIKIMELQEKLISAHEKIGCLQEQLLLSDQRRHEESADNKRSWWQRFVGK
ncbi:hypothetical protein [Fusibacillus kribbianus]|uniref:DUF536 domain-containing protein n=1 Tax=Fusibacillus kribbianus TaxID=3044208 RepID=A0AAP4EYI0_9FIRM|nr:hypothetical protein [Ruminococcus sp. YH-rum2234]MDI9243579.1 hypothetical protein [Ruminococcus sp. YH-rum2234]